MIEKLFENVKSDNYGRSVNAKTMYAKGETGNVIQDFINDEDGVGTIEIILILVVLIGLVVIFREYIEDLIDTIFTQINGSVSKTWK